MVKFWPLTWNYVVIILNANQSQTLILITWPNMSALWAKMGNPPPRQGIPYTTPSSSIFIYKNSLRKLWNYPIMPRRTCHLFLIISRGWYQPIIMRVTKYLPNNTSTRERTLNHRRVSKSPFCKARLHTSTGGPALHAWGFTTSPTIDFGYCNYAKVSVGLLYSDRGV